jgi:hypothetical protein
MSFITSQAEAEKMIKNAMESAWEGFEKDIIDTLPGMQPVMKPFLKQIFTSGFQEGIGFISIYMASAMLQSKLQSILDNGGVQEETSKKEPPTNILEQLIKSMSEKADGNPSSN